MKTKTWAILVFFLTLVALGYDEVSRYLKYSKIAENPAFAKAVVLDAESYRKKRNTQYSLKYEFEANGRKVAGVVSLSSYSAEKILDSGGIFEVVYNENEPIYNAMKSGYDSRRSLSELLIVLAKLLGLSAVVSPIVGFILAKKFGPKQKPKQVESQPGA